MGRLIKPSVNRIYESKVSQLTLDLSERSSVVAVTETATRCPNCIYDSVNKAGSGKYQTGGPKPFTGKTCPVCKNKGEVATVASKQLKCNVAWGKLATQNVNPTEPLPLMGGQLPINFARLKTDIANKAVIRGASYFVVDGVRCKIHGEPNPKGLLRYVQYIFYVKIDK